MIINEFLIDRVEKIFIDLESKKLGLQFFDDCLRHFQAYEFKQGKRKYEAAAQLLPNQAEILNNLGITLQQLGEWNKALTYHR